MFRYYQKALKDLEKSNDKHEAVGGIEGLHHEKFVNGQTSVNNRKRKKSDQRESSHTHETKRDSELKKKKKRKKSIEDWTDIEAVTRHDNVNLNEVRKKEKKKKKKKKKRRLEIDFEAGNSNDRESFTTRFNKPTIDPPIVSNNKESKKKRKWECLTEFSEETVKKGKQNLHQTSKSQKRRDRETCDETRGRNFSCNGRIENVHTSNSVESSTLTRTTNTCSFEISPRSSPQSSTHVSKKSSQSGKKSTKQDQKLKMRKKRTKDLKSSVDVSKDNFLNGNNNGTEVMKERVEPTLKMDEAKLREAVKISNKIHETWTLSKERLQALAEEGEC